MHERSTPSDREMTDRDKLRGLLSVVKDLKEEKKDQWNNDDECSLILNQFELARRSLNKLHPYFPLNALQLEYKDNQFLLHIDVTICEDDFLKIKFKDQFSITEDQCSIHIDHAEANGLSDKILNTLEEYIKELNAIKNISKELFLFKELMATQYRCHVEFNWEFKNKTIILHANCPQDDLPLKVFEIFKENQLESKQNSYEWHYNKLPSLSMENMYFLYLLHYKKRVNEIKEIKEKLNLEPFKKMMAEKYQCDITFNLQHENRIITLELDCKDELLLRAFKENWKKFCIDEKTYKINYHDLCFSNMKSAMEKIHSSYLFRYENRKKKAELFNKENTELVNLTAALKENKISIFLRPTHFNKQFEFIIFCEKCDDANRADLYSSIEKVLDESINQKEIIIEGLTRGKRYFVHQNQLSEINQCLRNKLDLFNQRLLNNNQETIITNVNKLIALLDRSSNWSRRIKNQLLLFSSDEPTAGKLKRDLHDYVKDENHFIKSSLHILLKKLNARELHVLNLIEENEINKDEYKDELDCIRLLMLTLKNLIAFKVKNEPVENELIIKEFHFV